MPNLKTTMRADWGPHLWLITRRIAPVMVAAYAAGWWLGQHIHRANDWLASRKAK